MQSNPTSNRKNVPDFFGRLYPTDLVNGSFLGTWVRRSEVDALLDEIEERRAELQRVYKLVNHWSGQEKRLRAALESIGEYDCPGGVHPKHCPGCAACDANKALSGDSSAPETPQPASNEKTMRHRMLHDEELSEQLFEDYSHRIALEAHEDRLKLWEDIERMREALADVSVWLRSALDCPQWRWDADQHHVAEECCKSAVALLSGDSSAPVKCPIHGFVRHADCPGCPNDSPIETAAKFVQASHASAPPGYKCADCAIAGEACPTCYRAWYRKRNPGMGCAEETGTYGIGGPVGALTDEMREVMRLNSASVEQMGREPSRVDVAELSGWERPSTLSKESEDQS